MGSAAPRVFPRSPRTRLLTHRVCANTLFTPAALRMTGSARIRYDLLMHLEINNKIYKIKINKILIQAILLQGGKQTKTTRLITVPFAPTPL